MSQRQKHLNALSEIVPAGLVGVSVLFGPAAPGSANGYPEDVQGASTSTVSERLAAIRGAISILTEGTGGEARPADPAMRLAWGNGWRNW